MSKNGRPASRPTWNNVGSLRFMRLRKQRPVMSADSSAPSTEKLAQRLRQSIDELCEDAARVEIWATALSAFAHAVPGYEPSGRSRLQPAGDGQSEAFRWRLCPPSPGLEIT